MQAAAKIEDDDTPSRGPSADEQRIAALEIANRSLTDRNGRLAMKTLQAELAFRELATRTRTLSPPSIAELDRAAAYFADAGAFDPTFTWPAA